MLTKINVIESIQQLPNTFSAEDVIDRIILLEKIEIGLLQSEKGHVIDDDELDKEIAKWQLD